MKLPSYASLSFSASAAELPHVTRDPGLRTPRGTMVQPSSTQFRIGPLALTLVWGNDHAAHPLQHETVAGYDEEV